MQNLSGSWDSHFPPYRPYLPPAAEMQLHNSQLCAKFGTTQCAAINCFWQQFKKPCNSGRFLRASAGNCSSGLELGIRLGVELKLIVGRTMGGLHQDKPISLT